MDYQLAFIHQVTTYANCYKLLHILNKLALNDTPRKGHRVGINVAVTSHSRNWGSTDKRAGGVISTDNNKSWTFMEGIIYNLNLAIFSK